MNKVNKIKVTNTPGSFKLSKTFVAVRVALSNPYWSQKSKKVKEVKSCQT